MTFPDIIIMGFGKMPADCAAILIENDMAVRNIWETEESQFSALEGFAKRVNIPFLRLAREHTSDQLNSINKPTVVFSINNNYIFPQNICHKANVRIVNFHNSLLPGYPGHGRVVPSWVIFNGESRHGVAWHLVSADIDAGDILCQADFELSENDTAQEVMMRCISLGIELFSLHWQKFISPQYRGTPQGQTHERIYGKNDIPNQGEIDLSWDFPTAGRFLRSMDYGLFKLLPPPNVNMGNKRYMVKKYQITKKENPITKNELRITQTTEGKGGEATILYPEGSIELTIAEED